MLYVKNIQKHCRLLWASEPKKIVLLLRCQNTFSISLKNALSMTIGSFGKWFFFSMFIVLYRTIFITEEPSKNIFLTVYNN